MLVGTGNARMFKHGIFVECPGLFEVREQFPCETWTVWSPGKVRVPFQESVQPEIPLSLSKHLNFLRDNVATGQEREHLLRKCAVP